MVTRQELEGKWKEVKGRVRERWGDLSDNELQQARGNAEQLVGVIQQKTGESRRQIEEFLDEIVAEGASAVSRAAENAKQYAEQATETAREAYEHVAAGVQTGYEEAQGMVRRNPMESVAVAFGAGIITGVIVGLVLKSR